MFAHRNRQAWRQRGVLLRYATCIAFGGERGGVELALVRYTQGETRRATFISQERAVKLRGFTAGNEQLLLG